MRPLRALAAPLVLLFAVCVAAGPWDSQASANAETDRLAEILQNDDEMRAEWQKWQSDHDKAAEGDARYATWKANMAGIISHNQKPGQTWWAGPNEWTDLTFEEFSKVALGLDASKIKGAAAAAAARPARRLLQTAPSAHDWVALGKTTPVKNQGSCGSCWAFATVGALEAAYKIQYGQTIDMSEQQITSCDPYDLGCDGGWIETAFQYVYESKVATEANYPYTSGSNGVTGTCSSSRASMDPRYGPNVWPGYITIGYESRAALKDAIYNYGPTVIAFMVESAFQNYRGGIFSTACATNNLNHAMVAVGYDEGQGYWKIRNSWGATWGEQGHARVLMTNDSPGSGLCNLHACGGWVPTATPEPCAINCITCDANKVCTSCLPGWTGSTCATPICPTNCASCSAPNSCNNCSGNYALPGCTSCISGYTLSSSCTKLCLAKSAACSANSDCCSNKCAGRKCT